MATKCTRSSTSLVHSQDDEALTDEQIQQLLDQATKNLRQKAAEKQLATRSKPQSFNFPKLDVGELQKPYVTTQKEIARLDSPCLLDGRQRKAANLVRKMEDPVAAKKQKAEDTKATAGPSWFNLPKTNLTPDLKRDLQLLKLRNVLDPHRHYKKDGGGKMKPPEFSHVGTIQEGPTEYFSGRLLNRDRKRTFVEEVLARELETKRFKRKYAEVQARKGSGKKAYYKGVLAKRSGLMKKGGSVKKR